MVRVELHEEPRPSASQIRTFDNKFSHPNLWRRLMLQDLGLAMGKVSECDPNSSFVLLFLSP